MNPRPQDIITAISTVFEMDRDQILSPIRGEMRIAYARQAAMALCRELTSLGLIRIGNQFGRDHTTVLYAVKKTGERELSDPAFKANLDLARGHIAAFTQARQRNIEAAMSQPLIMAAE
jgi:chromosomal replication initiation ATPase DnaA